MYKQELRVSKYIQNVMLIRAAIRVNESHEDESAKVMFLNILKVFL